MAPSFIRSRYHLAAIPVLIVSILAFPAHRAFADSPPRTGSELPSLNEFAGELVNGLPGQLRGVYAPGLFANLVVQQPRGDSGFVSPRDHILTQFSMAASLGSVGLLAHNYLAGRDFAQLQPGQSIYLVYGDGRLQSFEVVHILRFQAKSPGSPQSDFIDLDAGTRLTAPALFSRIYDSPGSLVLQTCIEADGLDAWGRLFVVAKPLMAAVRTVRLLSGR